MLKQINGFIINTDSIEQIYFDGVHRLVIRTNTGNESYVCISPNTEEKSFEIISKLNELLQDPRVTYIDFNELVNE